MSVFPLPGNVSEEIGKNNKVRNKLRIEVASSCRVLITAEKTKVILEIVSLVSASNLKINDRAKNKNNVFDSC